MVRDKGTYQKIVFSQSGRYMACIVNTSNQKENGESNEIGSFEVELYDFYNVSEFSKPKSLNSRLQGFGRPLFLEFSPTDRFLSVSYKSLSNDSTNIFKVYDFSQDRLDDWKFTYESSTDT